MGGMRWSREGCLLSSINRGSCASNFYPCIIIKYKKASVLGLHSENREQILFRLPALRFDSSRFLDVLDICLLVPQSLVDILKQSFSLFVTK